MSEQTPNVVTGGINVLNYVLALLETFKLCILVISDTWNI